VYIVCRAEAWQIGKIPTNTMHMPCRILHGTPHESLLNVVVYKYILGM
jgi:hypothetical protein